MPEHLGESRNRPDSETMPVKKADALNAALAVIGDLRDPCIPLLEDEEAPVIGGSYQSFARIAAEYVHRNQNSWRRVLDRNILHLISDVISSSQRLLNLRAEYVSLDIASINAAIDLQLNERLADIGFDLDSELYDEPSPKVLELLERKYDSIKKRNAQQRATYSMPGCSLNYLERRMRIMRLAEYELREIFEKGEALADRLRDALAPSFNGWNDIPDFPMPRLEPPMLPPGGTWGLSDQVLTVESGLISDELNPRDRQGMPIVDNSFDENPRIDPVLPRPLWPRPVEPVPSPLPPFPSPKPPERKLADKMNEDYLDRILDWSRALSSLVAKIRLYEETIHITFPLFSEVIMADGSKKALFDSSKFKPSSLTPEYMVGIEIDPVSVGIVARALARVKVWNGGRIFGIAASFGSDLGEKNEQRDMVLRGVVSRKQDSPVLPPIDNASDLVTIDSIRRLDSTSRWEYFDTKDLGNWKLSDGIVLEVDRQQIFPDGVARAEFPTPINNLFIHLFLGL